MEKSYTQAWQGLPTAQRAHIPDRESLPRASTEEIRAGAKSFLAATASSLDRIHPKCFSFLSDEALRVLSALWGACESLGLLPEQLQRVPPHAAEGSGWPPSYRGACG
eukprot:7701577-Pyramimonas_sp.AAC.1